MPLPPYTRATERFQCNGVDLNSPVDETRLGFYPILENVRSYTEGVIQPRQGLTVLNIVSSTNKTPIHSIRRLNDPATGNAIRLVGIQDTLSFWNSTSTTNTFTRIQYNATDIAISGNPLALIPYRPDQSVSSWMYIADSSVMRKVVGYNGQSITGGTAHQIGLPPPITQATIELASPLASVSLFPASSSGGSPFGWVSDGFVLTGTTTLASPIGPATFTSRIPAGNSVTAVAGSGVTGNWMALVIPQAVADVVGPMTEFWSTDGTARATGIVHEVFRASSTGLTITSILYDTGTSGDCIIQPSQAVSEIQRNCVVNFSTHVTAYSRVTDVIVGPDNSLSFRCNTTGTITATDKIQVVPSWFAFAAGGLGGVIGAGSTLSDLSGGAGGVVLSTGAGTASNKTGWIQVSSSNATDLSRFVDIISASGPPAFQEDDLFCTSVLLSDVSQLTQGRVMVDVDITSYSVTAISTGGLLGVSPVSITTAVAHNLSSGDTILISGNAAPLNANNTFIVQSAPTSGSFTILATSTLAAAGAGGGTARPLFKKNFYYRAFTPNDLVAVAKATQTAQAGQTNIIGNQPVDFPNIHVPPPGNRGGNTRGSGRSESGDFDPPNRGERRGNNPDDPNAPLPTGPARSQTGMGDFQWSQLRFHKSEFQRVGQGTQTLAAANALRFEFTFNSTSAITVGVNSNLLYGGYTLDSSQLGIPYIYRYRNRASLTGATSNWSPASRSGLYCNRDATSIVTTTSTVTEVDRVDIQRLGGINTTWLTIGTKTNTSGAFQDSISDDVAAANAPLSDLDTNYQLWPCVQKPANSASPPVTTTVVGPYLKDTTAPFNLAWAKGTAIKTNGIDTQIRRVVSTSILEMDDSLGSLTNPTWEIPAPLLTGQPLPALWAWNDTGFACGDTANPGRLYFTNPGSLDTTQDTFWLDVTSPSEPLQNGIAFNGKNYVWSTERMFEVEQIAPNVFIATEIPGRKGMISRWGLTAGERLWWIARDGIYQSGGGDAISITDESLRPFFVKEGNAGVAVNGFNPPDTTIVTKLRLSYYDGYLYFIYQDTSGNIRCLSYYTRAQKPGWWPDVYLDGRGITTLYGEEGSGVHSLLAGGNDVTTAKLYQVAGSADNTSPIASHVRVRSFDANDRRSNKYWGDLIIDTDSTSALNLILGLNNHATTATLTPTVTTVSTAAGVRVQSIIDVGSSGTITKARNADLDIQWSSTGTPKLYLWEPSFITLPEQSNLRPTYWDDLGIEGDKFIQGIEIETDTSNVSRTILVEYDGGTLADTLTVQHNGNQTKAYSFHPAFIAHLVRLRPTDSSGWETFKYKWIYQPESPLADHWETQQTSLGATNFVHMKEAWICLRSTMGVTLTVTRTDDATTNSYVIPTTSGNRMKVRVPFVAAGSKGKAFSFILSSTSTGGQFRLYKDDTVVLSKEWASEQAFANRNPWGAPHGDGQAPI